MQSRLTEPNRTTQGHGWRRVAVLLVALAATTVVVGTAQAQDEPPRHAHVMLVGVEVVPGSFPPVPSSIRNCVDLAANRALPLHVQHAHMHVGTVNDVFEANTSNVVIPVAPFPDPFGPGEVPWTDCESLLAFFGLDDS